MVKLWYIYSEKYYAANENNAAVVHLLTQKDLHIFQSGEEKYYSCKYVHRKKNIWNDLY